VAVDCGAPFQFSTILRLRTCAYRVLLTRAKQGRGVFVPQGEKNDPNRLPSFCDSRFNYLRKTGFPP
jgi:hypothetical protein